MSMLRSSSSWSSGRVRTTTKSEVEIDVELGAVGEADFDVVAVRVGLEGGHRAVAGFGEGSFAGSGEIGVWAWVVRWWRSPRRRSGSGPDGVSAAAAAMEVVVRLVHSVR